jgi:3-oxosteroid 1-dehydrogenase
MGACWRRTSIELAWPLPELMLFGGMMLTRGEAAELLRADRSPRGLALAARLVTRYLVDRLRHRRGTRLVLGNALVARLFKALLDRGVPVSPRLRAGASSSGTAVSAG